MISLNEGEQVLWEGRPDKGVLLPWCLTKLVGWMFMAVLLTFALVLMFAAIWMEIVQEQQGANPFPMTGVALQLVTPVALVVGIAYVWMLRRTYRYAITNHRCVLEGGVIIRRRRSVHYHKVTDVEVSQNPLERLLGLSSLKLYTAGTSSVGGFMPWGGTWERAEITFEGLRDPDEPERLINQALKRYKATGE